MSFMNKQASLASRLRRARNQTHTHPTPGQAHAGNYAKGSLLLHGMRIKLENPKGTERRGYDSEGNVTWKRVMAGDYGYFAGSMAADGDAVDCFIGDDLDSEFVAVVDQTKADGSFDESKVVLGTKTQAQAEKLYLAHYPRGWKLGPVSTTTVQQLKTWLAEGNTKAPFKGQLVKAAAGVDLRTKEAAALRRAIGRVITNVAEPYGYDVMSHLKRIQSRGLKVNLKAVLNDEPAYPVVLGRDLPYRRMFGLPAHRSGVGYYTKNAPGSFRFKADGFRSEPYLEAIARDGTRAARNGTPVGGSFVEQHGVLGGYNGTLAPGDMVRYRDRWDVDLNTGERPLEDVSNLARWLASKITKPVTIEGQVNARTLQSGPVKQAGWRWPATYRSALREVLLGRKLPPMETVLKDVPSDADDLSQLLPRVHNLLKATFSKSATAQPEQDTALRAPQGLDPRRHRRRGHWR